MSIGAEILRTARFIAKHPLASKNTPEALSRWLRWQVGSRILPGSVHVPFVENTVLVAAPGMTGATGNIYVGLHEFADMAFLLHYIRPHELFVDVGANIGSYTILASGVRQAQTLAFEPDAKTYAKLAMNIRANDIAGRVQAMNCAVGSRPGSLNFSCGLDTINHVVASSGSEPSVAVEVTTLDSILGDRRAHVVKVDVEGFETEVLTGAREALGSGRIDALIVELNGSGARYGFDDEALHRELLDKGFRPFVYTPFARRLEELGGERNPADANTIYLRDVDDARQRVSTAPAFHVLGLAV